MGPGSRLLFGRGVTVFGLPGWLLIIPVLTALVFIHELGHFITAKRFGIKVTEFGFGFPPRIAGFQYGETLYSINWLPLGGFVRMVGEEDPTDPRSFARQAAWKRAVVLVAGSFMNLVLPLVIFTTMFMLPHDVLAGRVVITGVAHGSPAQEAGLRPGDEIYEVDGRRIENTAELVQRVMAKLGRAIDLTIGRSAVVPGISRTPDLVGTETVSVVPRLNPPKLEVVDEVSDPLTQISLAETLRLNPVAKLGDEFRQGAVGVYIATANAHVVQRSYPIWEAAPMSVGKMRDVFVITRNGLARWAAGGDDPGLAGPIGIAQVTGEIASVGISPVFELMALLSISLGILNILPIPALDGGRLLFVGIEWARRGKRISAKREGLVHLLGFVVLIGLVAVMSYFDIVRIIDGGSLLR